MAVRSPVFKVSMDGITAPSYEEILEYFREKARGIFGSDINLDADTQDGQLLAIFALALHDVNSQAIAVFNSFNPNTAIGAALDSAVKTNGISRHDASHSTVDVRIVGQAGTIIRKGIVIDSLEQKWNLPAEVVIPLKGEITVTATAQELGAMTATAGSLTKIGTPTLGWQSVTNPDAATPGDDVESDAELRARQTLSTMQPSIGLWDGLLSSIAQLDDVQSVSGRHNDSGETDDDGIPAHSIALVVDGGDADEIAETIYNKKSQGVATYGSTSVDHIGSLGAAYLIKFSRPKDVPVSVNVAVKPTALWMSSVEDALKERIAAYINSLAIGTRVDAAKCVSVVVRSDDGFDSAFLLKGIKLNGVQDSVVVDWDQKASCTVEAVTVAVES
nr:MAG TPA: Baseplate J like protein [Caudoviricetes sp.]